MKSKANGDRIESRTVTNLYLLYKATQMGKKKMKAPSDSDF